MRPSLGQVEAVMCDPDHISRRILPQIAGVA
jgi:hypothetical protein